jgi:hypothetical protein
MDGLQEAAVKGLKKLVNFGKLPKHQAPARLASSNEKVIQNILKWRQYLATNFDKKPDQVLTSNAVEVLATFIKKEGHANHTLLSMKLKELKCNNDFVKGARLLDVYVDENKERFNHIKEVKCHNCCQIGHAVSITRKYS